jgi:hypothetical protein
MAHTPDRYFQEWDDSTVYIDRNTGICFRVWGPDHEATALIFACAPDMLAALQKVAVHFEGTDAPLGIEVRSIIARATGKDAP